MSEHASHTMFLEINSRRIQLEAGQVYLLGSQLKEVGDDIKNFVNLENKEQVDEKHCIIDNGNLACAYLYDLFSVHGTWLNNRKLRGLEKIRLKNGDVLKLGQQEVKFNQEQHEMSHDSSGFLEVNKNTSDIIISSPESTSQRENRLKRLNNNKFLMPSIPSPKSTTPDKDLVTLKTEDSVNRLSSSPSSANNRRSDSFTIPETQYCRNSLEDTSVPSPKESNTDISKIKSNFGNMDEGDDDDFYIPETQEVIATAHNQRPHADGHKPIEKSILEEKSAELDDEAAGSQFRICTQEYNEGFGEEEANLYSQVIPLIKFDTVHLNISNTSAKQTSKNESKIEEESKEMSALKWSTSNINLQNTFVRADCPTPDIFDFEDVDAPKAKSEDDTKTKIETVKSKTNLPVNVNLLEEDEEDFLPTQVFPTDIIKPVEKKSTPDNDKPCLDKCDNEFLTLSDKENRCPGTLEQIQELPSTQLITTNDVSSAISTTSGSSRNGNIGSLRAENHTAAENNNKNKSLLNLDPDEEDDLLTQAFLQPIKPVSNSASTSSKNGPVKCFNSTLLDGKCLNNNFVSFFAEMENTSTKQNSSSAAPFKVPDKDFLVLKKASSAASTTSETDLDLLMCTPQLIKEHIQVVKNDDLKKNILAAKNKNLFGDDTDDDDDDQTDLVRLINVPKNSKDFDNLLPHLKNNQEHTKRTDSQKTTKRVQKEYIVFDKGLMPDRRSSSSITSSTLSRDLRHIARDKEKELAERRNQRKSKTIDDVSKEKTRPSSTRHSSHKLKTDEEQQKPNEQKISTRARKRAASTDTNDPVKEVEPKKSKESKSNKSTEQVKASSEVSKKPKESRTNKSTGKERPTSEEHKKSKETKVDKHSQKNRKNSTESNTHVKSVETDKPVRRMTRSSSRCEEKTKSENKLKTKPNEHQDTDSIATQPYIRVTRSRSRSNKRESEGSTISNTSPHRSVQHDEKSIHHKPTVKVKNTSGEHKHKTETIAPPVPTKVEPKQFRSTNSQESLTHSSSTICISMTMVNQDLFKELLKNSNGCWSIAKNPAECDILVMDKAYRTFKFLLAMARGIPIVTSKFLKKINDSQSVAKVNVNDYLFADAEFEIKHKFSLVKSLQIARKQKLFKGYEFLMTSRILPSPSEIKAIIEASGGCVLDKPPLESKTEQKIYLVSSKEDKQDWHKYRRLNKNIVIVSTEAIMSSVMRQTSTRLSTYILS